MRGVCFSLSKSIGMRRVSSKVFLLSLLNLLNITHHYVEALFALLYCILLQLRFHTSPCSSLYLAFHLVAGDRLCQVVDQYTIQRRTTHKAFPIYMGYLCNRLQYNPLVAGGAMVRWQFHWRLGYQIPNNERAREASGATSPKSTNRIKRSTWTWRPIWST